MSKIHVSVKFDTLTKMANELVDKQVADQLGNTLLNEVKSHIARGESPVRGYGKFAPYKDPDKYPGDLKPAKPVNLNVTGEYLRWISWKQVGQSVRLGFYGAPSKIKKMFDTHNEGLHKHVPQRKHIPGDGEQFNDSILKKLKELYRLRVADIIRKSNSR